MTDYLLTTVSVPESDSTNAVDVDESGLVVGDYHRVSDGRTIPFVFDSHNNSYTELPPGQEIETASGINDAGLVVGEYVIFNAHQSSGFVYDAKTADYKQFNVGTTTSPAAINTGGTVTGSAFMAVGDRNHGTTVGFLYDTSTQISTTFEVTGYSATLPVSINDSRQVVGSATNFGSIASGVVGFLLSNGVTSIIDVSGSTATRPTQINNSGMIAGDYQTADATWGFLDNSTTGAISTIQIAGATSTFAESINDSGEVVGYFTDTTGHDHGYIFDSATSSYEFYDAPGATDTKLTRVNDSGQLVGSSEGASGSQSFILTPRTTIPCYCSGTAILTDRGYRPVDCLSIGDCVVTFAGQRRPIYWIGRRHVDLVRHLEPASVQPIRIVAGAFGESLPTRDVWMSPGHNVLMGDVLIPVGLLVNGTTIAQQSVDQVTYWHVELESHDVLLAEGLPAESYIDTGNRTAFENGGTTVQMHPDFRSRRDAATCAPIRKSGAEVEAARSKLIDRAVALGYPLDSSSDVHVLADDVRIEPIDFGPSRMAFVIPAESETIVLRSRTFVAGHTKACSVGDDRHLGICIDRLQIDGDELDLCSDLPSDGWHELEVYGDRVQRWTTGTTRLPDRTRLVIIDLCGHGLYWSEGRASLNSIHAYS